MVEMTATEFVKKLRAVLDRIEYKGEEIVLMRNKHRIRPDRSRIASPYGN
jgi:hypothetical protein